MRTFNADSVSKLLVVVQSILAISTHPDATGFDAVAWIETWMDKPHPALGGRTPSELIEKATGFEVVTRLLGSLESGAYQ